MNIPDDPKDDRGFEIFFNWISRISKWIELTISLILFAACLFGLWALWTYISHVRG